MLWMDVMISFRMMLHCWLRAVVLLESPSMFILVCFHHPVECQTTQRRSHFHQLQNLWELWSSTDSTPSYSLNEESLIRVVSERQVSRIHQLLCSCNGANTNVVLERRCVQCNFSFISLIFRFDGHAGSKCSDWCEKKSLECLCGLLWFFSFRFVGIFVMSWI